METNNQNLPNPETSRPPQQLTKWYQHKGLIAFTILVALAAGASWLYFSRLPRLASNSCEKAHLMINEKGYPLVTNGTCPIGYHMNALLCGTDLPQWCEPDQTSAIKETNTPFQIVKDFPFLAGTGQIYFDSEDKNTVWLSFSGAIVKYNLLNDTWETAITGVKGLDNTPWTLVRKGDNIFFSLYQTGFERINLKTGQTKNYTAKDGLPNNSNLKLYDDPGTADIWIATFGGASRFNSETEKFTNYTSQLGNGTHWGINDLVVNKDYVWVVVSANAYHTGGIGRFDKKTNTWKFWGPEAFNATQRVDITYGLDAFNGRAITNVPTTGNSSGDRIVEYNPETDKWEDLFNTKGTFYRNFTYVGNRVYMWGPDYQVFYFDRETKKVVKTGIKGAGTPSSYPHLSRDANAEKLVLMDWPNNVVIYDSQNNQTKQLKFEQREKLLSKLITANKEMVIFTNGRQVIIHSFINNSDRIILGGEEINENFEGKIIGDYLALIAPTIPGMTDCAPGKLVLINLKTNTLEKTVSESDYCFNIALVGNSISEIYITASDVNNQLDAIKRYDIENSKFIELPITSVNITSLEPVLGYISPKTWTAGGKNMAESIYDQIYSQQDYSSNTRRVNISQNGNVETRAFTLPSNDLDGFNNTVRQTINVMAFDATQPTKLYIGTSVGLIIYDIESKKEYLATTKDGLTSNNITKIISLPDNLILSNNAGAYIYKLDFSKLPN